MKRLITFVFAATFVLYVANAAAFAQGRGRAGFGGAASQEHGPDVNHVDHGQSGVDHGQSTKDHTRTTTHDQHAGFESRIESNPQLKQRVSALLPAGMDLQTAASGFKNQGQFIAALHVSKNLGIPFTDLKDKMTGPNGESLGKAIHDLKPALSESDARKEAEKAEKQTKDTENTKTNS